MKLREHLPRFQKPYVLLAVPVLAFLVALGVASALSGGGSSGDSTRRPLLSAENLDPPSSPTPSRQAATLEPTPTVASPPNRGDCDAIRGTDYLSPDERSWFLANCTGGQAAVSSGQSLPTSSGPAAVGASEYALGDRLIIPAAGVNTTVNGSVVDSSGQMATPVGYFNALWYDFRSYPGIGGYVDSGNLVLAGHVDCGRCVNGGPGAAVFYNIRNLSPGDTIQYVTASGQAVNYVVTGSEWYLPTANWSAILSSGSADLSIVTCIGNFDSSRREYTHRLVVYAKKT